MSESPAAPGAIIVISSHVVRGAVGNRAAVFALETLGHRVWALPTVILPWHPGHGPSTRVIMPDADFRSIIDDLIRAPWIGEVRAVLSGYMGSPAQAAGVARLVAALRERNPDLFYACDPIIGDAGGLYVPVEIATAIRELLMPLATLATPNRFELSWLAGAALETNADLLEAAVDLGPSRVLVTSAIPMMSGGTGNLYLSGRHALLAEHRLIDSPPNGTGDLLSAVFLARLLEGLPEERALQMATASVYEIIARSRKRDADELTLEQDASSLATPMAMVQMRRLLHPSQARKK
ncbi:pyridoxal kinase PdxY [Sinorhizobium medicae]|uniref:pyridoxal kinase n=2 Tax=Sinorhizobium medicae TaxID=110321 RepID=A0A6G1WPV2_9HYPH|nr:pyridoxal kinase PdxY [Sinorhizobium medicae]ABR62010.1 pyridoxal kinase [Sinorhizobium medicae WSM419]MBO1941111.1 pyridoxal kinase PdxY [Sinorhizobium medicae]MBO1964357.1 pyridoxal kinase PdxY [Sinorhizobium medicae]MDX0404377.1 pyridoxal kinase PdxY [Sinorhizobium medicae]MDX0410314.1 pyridoxal kinase PdxY [Sinorhizobium medicae]